MRKRVGIITFHAAWNYGAVLQCTALFKKLKSMGYEVQIIDYQPKSRKEKIVRNPISEFFGLYNKLEGKVIYKLFRSMLRFVRCIMDLKRVPELKKKKCGFECFRKDNLSMTCRYESIEELRKNAPDMDVYVCGSDQLWNMALTGGTYEPAYFLAFGKSEVKRIAYAVSACNITQEDDIILNDLLKNMDYISLRERKNQVTIEKKAGKEVYICPDPTLLLPVTEYEKMESIVKICKPYIFVYLLSKENAVEPGIAIIEEIKKRENIYVVDASPNNFLGNKKIVTKKDLSPGEWLYLIHNAEYVVTNSFHCTVFASLYNRRFAILPCHKSNMERLEEYAVNAGMKNRIIYTVDDVNAVLGSMMQEKTDIIDYQKQAIEVAEKYLSLSLL